MKYIITGSTGNISKPVAQQLIAAGHDVTILTSSPNKVAEIEALGAKAAVGSVEDAGFLNNAFAGADAAYLMIPPNFAAGDWPLWMKQVAQNYTDAVTLNNVKKVVVLSSVGAHMINGAGPVDGLAHLEQLLNEAKGTTALYLRPSYFFYNLFQLAGMIRHANIAGSAQPADHKMLLVHTSDIAHFAAKALLDLNFTHGQVQYIASDERSWEDITKVLSEAVGKPGTPFIEFTDEQSLEGMLQAGLSRTIAEGYTQMGHALRSGEMEADFRKQQPAPNGNVKLEDFAKEFAVVYNAG